MSAFSITSPCAKCPFRCDIKPYLRAGRVEEILRSLDRAVFPCHETTEHNEEGSHVESDKEIHCAGALILLEKVNRPSQMMRIAERLGIYDRRKLKMDAPVFDSFGEIIAAQRKAQRGDYE